MTNTESGDAPQDDISPEPMLRAECFSFTYEGSEQPTLLEIDLAVRRGEFLGKVCAA